GWIADVTYERNQSVVLSFRWRTYYPPQRCYWYRVIRRGETTTSAPFTGDGGLYKQMIVTVDRHLKAKTPVNATNPITPRRVEAALVSPYVVNVFPKVFIVQ